MELENKNNYSYCCQKPCYFIRMVQDFCCYPNRWDECKNNDYRHDDCKQNCNNKKEDYVNFDWEQEFESRYWNNQHSKNKDNKRNTNRCCCRHNY